MTLVKKYDYVPDSLIDDIVEEIRDNVQELEDIGNGIVVNQTGLIWNEEGECELEYLKGDAYDFSEEIKKVKSLVSDLIEKDEM